MIVAVVGEHVKRCPQEGLFDLCEIPGKREDDGEKLLIVTIGMTEVRVHKSPKGVGVNPAPIGITIEALYAKETARSGVE